MNLARRLGLTIALVTSVASAADPLPDAPPAAPAAPESAAAAPASEKPATSATEGDLGTDKKENDAKAAPPPEAAPREADKESGEDATYGHGLQLGIRGGVVLGYKVDFRYDHSPLCRAYDSTKAFNDQQKICAFGAPPAGDIALSFAPFDSVEPYIFARFGFVGEKPTNTNALQLFGLGARIYTMSDSRFKIFIEPALAWETESGAGNLAWSPAGLNPQYKKDMIFHVGVGPQYDFARAFGMFVNAGIDVGVLREISATLLVNIGVQIRVP